MSASYVTGGIDCIVVGGGISGLAVAYELHKRGVPFRLLEQRNRLGGVILNEHVDGYTIDAGPDALLVQKPDGIALCQELGLGDRLVPTRPPRLAYVQRGGQLHALPVGSVLGFPTAFGPLLTTRLFTWTGKMRMAAEVLVPPRRDDRDESIGDFVTRRFGEEATDYIAEPLLAGIHAGDVSRLSIRALFPRLSDAERKYGSLIRGFRHPPQTARAESRDGAFKSLPGGLSEIVDALSKRLPPGSVCVGTPVSRIAWQADRACFRIETGSAPAIETRSLVLATPAYLTGDLVRNVDADFARLCRDVPYASTATIAMAFRRDVVVHPLNGSGFVVPRAERTGILAASWLSSKWPNRAPGDRVLLRTFVGGARDPQSLERSDPELVSLSLQALAPILGISGEPLLSRVYRWERATPQYEVGHLDRLTAIQRALDAVPGLFVTGSGFRGVGIPDCVADARATGTQVAQFLSQHRAASLP
jgi:oxygen-dependent protoporphyrinogen oxidase